LNIFLEIQRNLKLYLSFLKVLFYLFKILW
jgi:hypothetical protein